MADRTKEELRDFLNSQLHLKPKDRDWALTDGEIHTMLVNARVLFLQAEKIVDEAERIKKIHQAVHWATMLGEYCPGCMHYLEVNAGTIFKDAERELK